MFDSGNGLVGRQVGEKYGLQDYFPSLSQGHRLVRRVKLLGTAVLANGENAFFRNSDFIGFGMIDVIDRPSIRIGSNGRSDFHSRIKHANLAV